jgi:hypothetical protein
MEMEMRMSLFARITPILGILLSGLVITLTPLGVSAQTPLQPKPLTTYLNDHNWTALSIPDSKMQPGSVIKVKKLKDFVEVQWLGDIRRCGINDQELGVIRGKYPKLGIGESFEVKASLFASVLNLFRINAGADKISGAILNMEDSGGDAIDFLAFLMWVASNGNRLQAVCGNLLGQDDVYLVTEAFRISKGSYQLLDKNGAKVELSASVTGKSLDSQLEGTIGTKGELVIAGDFYFGVRRAKMVSPGVFTSLGAAQDVPEADDLLREAQ